MKIISSEKFPIGERYSSAIQTGNLMFLSGQQGSDPTTGEFAQDGIRGETKQALENIKALPAVPGTDLAHVVKVNAYVTYLPVLLPRRASCARAWVFRPDCGHTHYGAVRNHGRSA
jgi:enamine deaminase RidA (YjgF/YER057c/UK114 family)